jgi:hypothetical protein
MRGEGREGMRAARLGFGNERNESKMEWYIYKLHDNLINVRVRRRVLGTILEVGSGLG